MERQGPPPMDVNRLRVGRFTRCPKCRASFQSMRLTHQSCPACGHDWEVASRRGPLERLRDWLGDLAGGGLILLMWFMLVGLVIGAFVAFYVFVERVSDGRGPIALAIAVVFVAIVIVYGLVSRGTQIGWWNRNPIDQYRRDDDPRDRR